MAGDWIKMRTDLATSPKVVRISSALRADRFRTVGALHAVWCLFDAHSLDGKLEGYNLGTIDDLIGFTGFAEAMASVGWLIESAGSLELPRFDDHNGSSAKRRAMESDRKRKGRLSASDADADADELRAREEKRREEESKAIAIAAANCDQPANSNQQKSDPVPYEQIFEAYAINLPELPQVRIKDDARRRAIKSRWNADKRFQDVDFWHRYFASVRASKFLMEGFKGIGFDWLMNSANFKKVAEGNYQ